MLYVRKDIPSKLIAFEDKPIESLFVEFKLQNSYNPHKSDIKKTFDSFKKFYQFTLFKIWENLNLDDFNVKIEEANIKSFCENYNLKSFLKINLL